MTGFIFQNINKVCNVLNNVVGPTGQLGRYHSICLTVKDKNHTGLAMFIGEKWTHLGAVLGSN